MWERKYGEQIEQASQNTKQEESGGGSDYNR